MRNYRWENPCICQEICLFCQARCTRFWTNIAQFINQSTEIQSFQLIWTIFSYLANSNFVVQSTKLWTNPQLENVYAQSVWIEVPRELLLLHVSHIILSYAADVWLEQFELISSCLFSCYLALVNENNNEEMYYKINWWLSKFCTSCLWNVSMCLELLTISVFIKSIQSCYFRFNFCQSIRNSNRFICISFSRV